MEDELELTGDEWFTTLCQEGHGLCYEITHHGQRFHFQPGALEWNHAQLMKLLDETEED
jgi:hypothetical protein